MSKKEKMLELHIHDAVFKKKSKKAVLYVLYDNGMRVEYYAGVHPIKDVGESAEI